MPPFSPGPTFPLRLIQNPNPDPTSIPIFAPHMESISGRERIILSNVPRDPFTGVADSRRRDSDVDFHDVFGGPPRRSSIYEPRRSRADSIDSCRRGQEELVKSRRSRLGSGEKPVFGDEGGSGWRQQLGDDFYSDIFQRSESGCSSPRRGDRDPLLSSAPGSRVLSPNRPTSLRRETLLADSLSVKLLKVLDHPVFAASSHRSVCNSEDGGSDMCSFPSSPNALSTGFTTQCMVGHGKLRNNAHVSYHQSSLPRRTACSFESLSETSAPACQAIESQIGKSSSSLETYVSNGQFHFSIYKWAGKGVTLVMPSNSKETNGYEGKLKKIPEIIVQEFEVPANCDYFSPVTKVAETKTAIQEGKSANDNVVDRNEDGYITTAENFPLSESDPKILQDDRNETSEKIDYQIEKVSIPATDKISNTSNAHVKKNPDFKSNSQGEQNPELKSLSQLLDDDITRERSDDIPRQAKEDEALFKDQKKQQLRRKNHVAYGEARSAAMIDSPSFSEDRTRRHKVKGKVKEFIKKFNQEVLPKPKGTSKMRDRKSRDKGNREDKSNKLAQASNEADELQSKSWNKNLPLFDIPNFMENKIMENAEEEKFSITCDGHMINDLPSEEKNETMHPSSETTPEVLDIAAWDEEINLEDIEGFLEQQLSSKESKGVQNSSQQVQIKMLDSKVHEWSKGKEENIRSLLSTLQYVLWPESGWKQVPLVDIIEGASVKKAYQRALLCLHPDKLQQKGASSNQKYIAEKVFDILQEAWDQFNSVGQF